MTIQPVTVYLYFNTIKLGIILVDAILSSIPKKNGKTGGPYLLVH